MPPPTKISWLMEDTLEPWVHFLPVEADFSDLPERVDWCLSHPRECEAIGREGRCFMTRFLDRRGERRIRSMIGRRVFAAAKHACPDECAAPYAPRRSSPRRGRGRPRAGGGRMRRVPAGK